MNLAPHDIEEFDPDLQIAEADAAAGKKGRRRGRDVLQIIGHFIFGQGATQGLSILINLFLVHRLSIEAYAQFGLANGFQGLFAVLMDFGFASTIVPMVADRRDDKAVVGRYVRAANYLRNRSYVVLAPLAAICFFAITHGRHWGIRVQCLLLGSILLSLYSGGTMSYFSTPLFIFGRLRDYYLPQVIFGACRLAAYVALSLTGTLTSWAAAGLAALTVTATARSVRRKSASLLVWPKEDSPEINREVVRYILPAAPAIVFSAFQPQIALFLVSIFGGTLYIAQVAALGRIAQVFTILITFGNIVVEPYVARAERRRLPWIFMYVILLTSTALVPVIFVSFKYSGIFIWMIGSKYEGLRGLLGWYVLSLSMNLVSTFVWIMNRARKWVFWSGSVLEVALVLGVQIGFLAIIGVRNTREAVFFNLAASCCYAIAHGYVTVYGFVREARLRKQAAMSPDGMEPSEGKGA